MRVVSLSAAVATAATLAHAAPRTTERIVRFMDADGVVRHGSPPLNGWSELIEGDAFGPRTLTGQNVKVAKLLAPTEKPPAVYGIGLNYAAHAHAANYSVPPNPIIFFKNRNSYNHPNAPIPIPKFSIQPDYEGELVFIFKKDCKDVSADEALDCVLGYTVGNDVSARCWQGANNKSGDVCPGNGGQWSFSKGLDGHGPYGPELVMTSELGDAKGLILQTRVNGMLMQNDTTDDMIFDIKEIVRFMTQGTTVEKGTVVFSGTPDGVGATHLPQPFWLSDGDNVTISIMGIKGRGVPDVGVLTNPVKFL